MAGAKKKARRERRILVFIDESGLSQRPHRCRTWAPRGQTPILHVPLTHDHLSAISAITLDGRLFLQVREDSYDGEAVVDFLRVVLRQIPVSPAWPEAKAFVIREMPYYTRCRVVFQSRTRFWRTDKISPNWAPPDPRLNELWSMAEEVNTPRGILLGGAQAGVTASASLADAFARAHPLKQPGAPTP